jgi:SAM-dependent methyltransferase
MALDPEARARRKSLTQALLDAATEQFNRGTISRAEWQQQIASALSDAYLADDDPRWQSGFDGSEILWREARSLVLLAAPIRGSFLDVGCANGYLLESIAEWAPQRGQQLDLYGLELDPELAATARRRLPELASHIYTGNVSDWVPPKRFDCVRTGLEYVPAGGEVALLSRIALEFVEDGGRVLVGPINDAARASTRDVFVGAGMRSPEIVSQTDHEGKIRHVVWSETTRMHRRDGRYC